MKYDYEFKVDVDKLTGTSGRVHIACSMLRCVGLMRASGTNGLRLKSLQLPGFGPAGPSMSWRIEWGERLELEGSPMKVRELQDGAPGGWIAAEAFRVDKDGSVWVDLDAELRSGLDPEADLLQIRLNQELFADESGLKLGSKRLIEVPAEELAGRKLDRLATPDFQRWGRVTLWQPWSYSWTLRTLPVMK